MSDCLSACLPVCKYWGSSIWPNTISAHPSAVATHKVSFQLRRYTSLQLSRHTRPWYSSLKSSTWPFLLLVVASLFLSLSTAECWSDTGGDFQRCGHDSGICCRKIENWPADCSGGTHNRMWLGAVDRLCPPQLQFKMKGFEGCWGMQLNNDVLRKVWMDPKHCYALFFRGKTCG